ncbi:MAG: cell division protein ZapA [Clostridia bacterium]|nr:cell division protein ZapA [Clostridia bacterium]
MNENSTKTTIRLLGNEYTITSNDTEEYIHRVAFYVDKMLTEIYGRNNRLSTNMAAVLASVNIADELFKTKEKAEETEKYSNEISSKFSEKERQIEELKKDNEIMRQEIQRLKIEIAKLEVRK